MKGAGSIGVGRQPFSFAVKSQKQPLVTRMLGYNEGLDKGLPLVELFGPLSRDWHQRRFWTSFWFAFWFPLLVPFSRWHQRRFWTSFWFAFWSPFWSLSRDRCKWVPHCVVPFWSPFWSPFSLLCQGQAVQAASRTSTPLLSPHSALSSQH